MARASLEELRLDDDDSLRQRGRPLWSRDDPRRADLIRRRPASADAVAEWIREEHGRGGHHGQHRQSTKSAASTPPTYAELAANAALVLIAVACSLVDRQIAAQAAAFEHEGGFTERLYNRRQRMRRRE